MGELGTVVQEEHCLLIIRHEIEGFVIPKQQASKILNENSNIAYTHAYNRQEQLFPELSEGRRTNNIQDVAVEINLELVTMCLQV